MGSRTPSDYHEDCEDRGLLTDAREPPRHLDGFRVSSPLTPMMMAGSVRRGRCCRMSRPGSGCRRRCQGRWLASST